MWAEDQLVPLRKEVMELSREHDALRRQIRKEHNASVKLQLKKEENLKSKALNQKRAKLFQMEDEYNDKVDTMTSRLQSSMENTVSSNILFRLKWEIK
jgi:DNA anti-recombination protein RmuC